MSNWLFSELFYKHIGFGVFLNSENEYCKENMKHLSPLQKTLYDEMLSHLKETDEDVPYKHGTFTTLHYYNHTIFIYKRAYNLIDYSYNPSLYIII